MLEGAGQNPCNDFQVAMGMRLKAGGGGDQIVVDHPQHGKSHRLGIVVVSEREGMPALEPVEAGCTSRVAPSYLQHDWSPRFANFGQGQRSPLSRFAISATRRQPPAWLRHTEFLRRLRS